MTNPNFDQGRSVGEREGVPFYGDANEAYRVSGGGVTGLLPPDSGNRNEPIRGAGGAIYRRAGSHGLQMIDGTDIILGPSDRQVQGLVLERMAQNISTAQYDHSHTIAATREMPNKADYPTSGPHIRASLQFGLGPNVAMAADLGHDPIDTPIEHDYRRAPEGPVPGALDKYRNAAGVLAQPVGNASGFTRLHEASQFPTMGTDILNGVIARNEAIATSRIPLNKPAAPRSNRMLGQSRKAR